MRILVIVESESWTPPSWVMEYVKDLLLALDDYLTVTFQTTIEFIIRTETESGGEAPQHDSLFLVTTGFLDFPGNGVENENGWYSTQHQVGYVRMSSPGYWDRLAMYFFADKKENFQRMLGINLSHEMGHDLSAYLHIADLTHDFLQEEVDFHGYTFQRLR